MAKILLIALFSLILCRFDNGRDIVEKINKLNTTWKAQEVYRDYDKLLGTFLNYDNKFIFQERVFTEEELNLQLPDTFDLRQAYPNCSTLKDVRDQSSCGSCWAFGASEAMSDRICIFSNGTLQPRISPMDLLTCCHECGFGCDGGWHGNAWRYWETNGICTGGLYGENNTCKPYFLKPRNDEFISNTYTPPCENKCNAMYKKPYEQDKFYAKESYSAMGEENMMRELYTRGSIECAFSVFEDFKTYKSGVYQYKQGKFLGGHAIKIIGWGVENGVKYWLCVNSWNTGWGDNGYFKMLRGVNHLGIETSCFAGTPKL